MLQKLLYIVGFMLFVGGLLAQTYGPLRQYPLQPDSLSPLVYFNTPVFPAEDTLTAAGDTVAAMDSSCLVIDCVIKGERLLPRYIFNETILRKIAPPAFEQTAEYREVPPPPKRVRQVVAESEVVPIKRERHGAWLFTFLTVQFFLIVYLRVGFFRYAEEQYRSFFNLNIGQQVFRDQELSMPFPALLLTINGVLSYAILLYLGLSHYGLMGGLQGWMLFLASFGIIFAISGFKYLLMWITGAVFPFKDEVNFYNFNFFLNLKMLGALLLPINFVIAYAPPQFTEVSIWAGVGLLALAYAGLAVKGLAIAKNYLAFYKFHFFVYICSLEIAPVLILVKVVMNAAR